jgi:hypothetical protein
MFPQLDPLKNNEVDRAKLIKCIKLAWAAITTDQINALIDHYPVDLTHTFLLRVGIQNIKEKNQGFILVYKSYYLDFI